MVHRTRIALDAEEFALQILRDQIGQRVYPTHRLDRKTSGVLLFAKDEATNAQVQQLFRERKVKKIYTAIVRGFAPEAGLIDYPLGEKDKIQEAQTRFRRIQTFEIPVPFGKFETSRYSLVELYPFTGRFHQIRKHMAHIFHPIIGDRPHGCNKQNKLWKEKFGMMTMLLHAEQLEFEFREGELICIGAPKQEEFEGVLKLLRSYKNL